MATHEEQHMFVIEKTFTFEASHRLPNHDGKCKRLHGHSWKVTLTLHGQQLKKDGPQKGMLVDYCQISDVFKPFLEEKLDHWHLNDTTGLENPTSESIAQ